jgi:hypothetical protein
MHYLITSAHIYGVKLNNESSRCYFILQSAGCTYTVNTKALPLSNAHMFIEMNSFTAFSEWSRGEVQQELSIIMRPAFNT